MTTSGKRPLALGVKIYIALTTWYFGAAIISTLVFYRFSLSGDSFLFPIVEMFYWLCGMSLNYFMNRNRNRKADTLLNIYMMCRMVKFMLTVAIIFIGLTALDAPKMPFTIFIVCNFLIYSFFEVYIYHLYNKQAVNGPKK